MTEPAPTSPDPETVAIDRRERRIAWLAAAWFFCWFTSYFIQKPLQDEFGILQGVEQLPWMFGLTAGVVLAANLAFSAFAGRRSAIAVTRGVTVFVAFVLFVFATSIHFVDVAEENWLARTFYVWVALFSLFAVSVFWGSMAQIFPSHRAKRWFGVLSAGGTLGAVCGSFIVSATVGLEESIPFLAGRGHTVALLVLAAVLVIAGGFFAMAIARIPEASALTVARNRSNTLEAAFVGVRRCLSSPYLLAICVFFVLYTITSTALYIERSSIVSETITDSGGRKAYTANLNMWTQSLSLVGQLIVTSAFLRWIGIAGGLAFVPCVTIAGFCIVGGNPVLSVVMVVEISRRVAEYVVTRPSREVLFTVLPPEEKYEAKVFVDTFVYRMGDALGGALVGMLQSRLVDPGRVLIATVPIAIVWLVLAIFLGRWQVRLQQNAPG